MRKYLHLFTDGIPDYHSVSIPPHFTEIYFLEYVSRLYVGYKKDPQGYKDLK